MTFQRGLGEPPGVHSASTWDPHRNAELHIHDEDKNNKRLLNVTS